VPILLAVLALVGVDLPVWLQSPPDVREQSFTDQVSSLALTYNSRQQPGAIVEHYRKQMDTAGIKFQSSFDGIGISIRVHQENTATVIRIREIDSGTQVTVSHALVNASPLSLPVAPVGPACPAGTSLFYQDHTAPPDTNLARWQARNGVEPPTPVCSEVPPLKLEWPDWLKPRNAMLTKSVQIPARFPTFDTRWDNQPYLQRTFSTSDKIEEVYAYFNQLLPQYGYPVYNSSLDVTTSRTVSVPIFGGGNADPLPSSKPHSYYSGAHHDALQHPVKVVVYNPRDMLAGSGDDKYTRQIHVGVVPASGGAIVEIRIQVRNH
jgi:hypothetical protein